MRFRTVMQTIPMEVVDRIWDRFNGSTREEADAMAKRAQHRQPYILVYLLAMDENMSEGELEHGLLLELGAFILEVMQEANPRLRQVTGEELDAAEEANIRFLQDMDEGREMEHQSAMKKLISHYNQMPLLGAIVEALMAGHEDSPEMAPESIGAALIPLKTVIDCLDQ